MPIAEARVETDRPSRYLVQLCRHFSNKGRHLNHRPPGHHGGDPSAGAPALAGIRPDEIGVEWSDTHGTLSVPWGRCTLQATAGALVLRAEADDEENLQRLEDLLTGHLTRFSRRDPLTVDWRPSETPAARLEDTATTRTFHGKTAPHRRGHLARTGFAAGAAVAAVVAVHLGLGGAALADTRWTAGTVGLVTAAVAVKLTLLGGFTVRRRGRRTGES